MRARLAVSALVALVVACGRHTAVHALALPEIPPPELPDAPGRAMVVGACSTCHSLRYLVDEPPLPRRVWAAEVDKMRRSYGAPIPEEMAAPIVDYLSVSLDWPRVNDP